ncbi:hypothetical protein [Thalassoroseus pseudoceratinae]|uniref:hypothetical protein n=1 Tax=Thalassoroseus pseudoceratinae TaxID=2713176 RepID=UPI00142156FA|nr:hypothetical protein [Thalassoroseus pseudoceratinae]
MRVYLTGLLFGLTLLTAGFGEAAEPQTSTIIWPPAAIAESPNRALAKPIVSSPPLTIPQERLERYERTTDTVADTWTTPAPIVDVDTPPTIISPVIELPPRDTRTPSAEEQAWEQIRQRERIRANARRARIAYRKAIGYSTARPTLRGSIFPPQRIYRPVNPYGFPVR